MNEIIDCKKDCPYDCYNPGARNDDYCYRCLVEQLQKAMDEAREVENEKDYFGNSN